MNKLLMIGAMIFCLANSAAPKKHLSSVGLDLGNYQISSVFADPSHKKHSTGSERKLKTSVTNHSKSKHRPSSVGLDLGLSSEKLSSLIPEVDDQTPTVLKKKVTAPGKKVSQEHLKKLMAQVDEFLGEPDTPTETLPTRPLKPLVVQPKPTKKITPKDQRLLKQAAMIKLRDSLVRLRSDSEALKKSVIRRNLVGPQVISQSQAQKNYQRQLLLEKKQLQSQAKPQTIGLQKSKKLISIVPQPKATVHPVKEVKVKVTSKRLLEHKKEATAQKKVADGLDVLKNDDADLKDMQKTKNEIDKLNKMLGENEAGINKLEAETGLEDDIPVESDETPKKPEITAVVKPKIKIQTVLTQIKKKNSNNIHPERKVQSGTTTAPAATTTAPAATTTAPTATGVAAVTPPYACPTTKNKIQEKDNGISVQSILDAVNKARTDPKGFAAIFKKMYVDPVDDTGKHCLWGIILREKRAGVQELYNWLLNDAVPTTALKGNGCMTVDAFTHARYMSDANIIDHTELAGTDILDLKKRLQKWGKFDQAAEAIGTIQKDHVNAYSLVGHIMLDDGISSRVNRKDMFDTNWAVGGAGLRTNGLTEYYSVTYAKHYHCTMVDSMEDWLKTDSGAMQFFGGVRDLTAKGSVLSLTVCLILFVNLFLF